MATAPVPLMPSMHASPDQADIAQILARIGTDSKSLEIFVHELVVEHARMRHEMSLMSTKLFALELYVKTLEKK